MRTLRTIGVIGSAAVLLLSASVVFAEGRGVASTSVEKANSDYRAMAASTTARMQTMRAEVQTRMETVRNKVMQRMSDIQDKVKQDMAQKLSVQFDNLNTTWTDNFVNLLNHYDAIVQKMQDRATIAAGNGKDVTTANTAIQSARTAILSARTAVATQALKVYTPDTSSTNTVTTTTPSGQDKIMKGLRTSFQKLHTGLFKDLFALRDGPMKDARKAVQSALETLGKVPGVDGDKNATTTEATN